MIPEQQRDALRTEVARWQALATQAVEALRGLKNDPEVENLAPTVRMMAADKACADFDASPTTELDEMLTEATKAGAQALLPTLSAEAADALALHATRIAQEARGAAFEEAAKVADSYREAANGADEQKWRTANAIGAAIRALAKKVTP